MRARYHAKKENKGIKEITAILPRFCDRFSYENYPVGNCGERKIEGVDKYTIHLT